MILTTKMGENYQKRSICFRNCSIGLTLNIRIDLMITESVRRERLGFGEVYKYWVQKNGMLCKKSFVCSVSGQSSVCVKIPKNYWIIAENPIEIYIHLYYYLR